MILTIKKDHPSPRIVDRVAEALRNDNAVAFPTDTVYALGASLTSRKATDRIYLLKNHKRNKPLSILCADIRQVSEYAYIDNAGYRMMRRCLPGPYTFILNATRLVPHPMTSRRRTVGIRVPDHPVALAIIEALGNPLISTSAMSQERQVLDDPTEIEKKLGHALACVLDAGPIPYEPSTIIDLSGPEPVVVRRGKGALEPLGLEEAPVS